MLNEFWNFLMNLPMLLVFSLEKGRIYLVSVTKSEGNQR